MCTVPLALNQENLNSRVIFISQDRAVKNFGSADKTFGHMLSKRLEFYNKAKDEPKSKV